MVDPEAFLFEIPHDFVERCQQVNRRIGASDEAPGGAQAIADQLGVPLDFYKAAQAIYLALLHGKPVIVAPEIRSTAH